MKQLYIFFGLILLQISFAQVQPMKSRIIFDANAGNSQSIRIKNASATEPFLAQSWIQDASGSKVVKPFIALPMLQRMDPGQEKMVKINFEGTGANIPQDRESLYSYNLAGIPPKSNATGQMNVVISSEIKLFYRPKNLPKYELMGWLKELQVTKRDTEFTLANPTAYHIVIYGFNNGGPTGMVEKDVVLKPFSTEIVNAKVSGNTVAVYIVNDYGSAERIIYHCQNNNPCSLTKVQTL